MSDAGASRFPRVLSQGERQILDWLLDVPFEGRDALRLQAAAVQVVDEWPDGPTVDLGVGRGAAPPSTVNGLVPTEAKGRDPSGALVGVLLHTREGYLSACWSSSTTGSAGAWSSGTWIAREVYAAITAL